MSAERYYEQFIRHCKRCRQCGLAGGEFAKPKDLCPIGRQMADTWERAEQRESDKAWAEATR